MLIENRFSIYRAFMDRKNKACWNCGNYKAYYTKGLCYFDRLDFGWCKKEKRTVDKHEQCPYWCSDYSFRKWRKSYAKHKLDELADAIYEIRQILAEDSPPTQNENKS